MVSARDSLFMLKPVLNISGSMISSGLFGMPCNFFLQHIQICFFILPVKGVCISEIRRLDI